MLKPVRSLLMSVALLLLGNGLLNTLFFAWGGLAFSLYPLAVAQLIDQLHPQPVT